MRAARIAAESKPRTPPTTAARPVWPSQVARLRGSYRREPDAEVWGPRAALTGGGGASNTAVGSEHKACLLCAYNAVRHSDVDVMSSGVGVVGTFLTKQRHIEGLAATQ